jgi:hypothetical protein
VIVHSAGIQDRDGAALVFDKIRQRFNWLELVWADNGYNAWQVNKAIAANPGLCIEIVKRSDDIGLRRPAPPMGRRAHLLLVRPQPALEQGL